MTTLLLWLCRERGSDWLIRMVGVVVVVVRCTSHGSCDHVTRLGSTYYYSMVLLGVELMVMSMVVVAMVGESFQTGI